jgi:DNA repair exonuclease SbcCD ATPase subunit
LQAVASSRLKQVKKELVELVGVSAPPASAAKKAEEVKKLRKEISDKEAAQETRVTRRDGLLRVREQRVAEHRAKKQALSAAHDEYDKIAVTKVDKDSAEKVLQANRDNELAVERHRAKLEEFQRTVEEKERALEQGRAVRDRGARAAVWVTLLSRAREKAHRDNLPAKVHHAALEDLEEKVNESLGEFDSPFRVSATEDLSFTAHFNNGTVVPAAALSGGQKMLLAISFRLVVNSTYADQMGIMILDEPTDGLDQANRALAADVFVRLGDLAKRRGHQIIVVTHDEILHRTFDEILSL